MLIGAPRRNALTVLGISGSLGLLLTFAICWSKPATAQSKQGVEPPAGQIYGETAVGAMGVTETVAEIMERAAREDVAWDGKVHFAEGDGDGDEDREHEMPDWFIHRQQNPAAPAVSQWPPPETDDLGQAELPKSHNGGPFLPQTIGTNVLGTQISETPGFIPPDSHGAVGPTQIVVIVNGRIKTLAKATGAADGALSATTDTFFSSVRNGSGTSDPMVKYDRTTGRWFVSIINVSTPNRIMLAVSSGSTIVSSASFTFFFIATPAGLFDYPGMGVDANAVYIGGNIFNPSFTGADGYVIRKSSVLAGGPIVSTRFASICNSSGVGPYSPRGVDNDDAAATEGYFIGISGATFSEVDMRRVSTPGGTPTISGDIAITVPTEVLPISVTCQGGSGNPLDALDDRLFAATIHKNRLTGLTTLWSAHNIEVNTSGVGTTGGGRNGSRWYEFQNLTTTPTVRQAGTLFDSAASNPNSYWIPGACMSGQGHMAIGTSVGGLARHAEAATAGRLGTDALGSTQAPTTIVTTSTTYNVQSGTQRWGDYSQTCVDPSDDMTMWTFQEYCNATNSWGVRATKLIAPPPATPASCSPAALNQGDTGVNVVLTGTSASGSGFFDPDATFPNHIAAAVNGGNVTVNTVTFTDPTHISLNVTVGGAAATGARTITVTNPDGQAATSATGILTINGGCVGAGVSGQPSNQTVCSGGSASFTVTGSGTTPLSFQWRRGISNLANGGNISGATAATLTINPAGAGDAGTDYNCVVSNTCGNATSNNATLTVNTAASVTGQPSNQTVCSGGSASFTVTAGGSPAPTFQWRKGVANLANGGNIRGATSATLTINPAGAGDAASNYNCVVTNSCGSATSNNASLTVNTAAGISGQPANQTVFSGSSASFTVTATGTPAPTYQWRKGVTNLVNGGNISGATTATLTVNPANLADAAANYNCVVTNTCGSATSNNATLTVNCPGDLNGDHIVDLSDLAILIGNYGKTGVGYNGGDLDGSGLVDLADIAQELSYYGKPCP